MTVHHTDPVRSLRSERAELNALITELCDGRRCTVLRDDRTVTVHTAPALIAELREQVGVGGERTNMGATAPGSRLPISAGAADALTVIEQRSIRLQEIAVRREGPTIESRLQYVAAVAAGWADPSHVAWLNDELRDLAAVVNNTLTPPRRFAIRRPCPACGATTVEAEHLGEIVRAPALTVNDRQGAECAGCGAQWPAAYMEHLNKLLDEADESIEQTQEG